MGGPGFCNVLGKRVRLSKADNFAHIAVSLRLPDGSVTEFPSSEAAYQAYKFTSPDTGLVVPGGRSRFDALTVTFDGNAAWGIGQRGPCRADWEAVKVSAMLHVCRLKGEELTSELMELSPSGSYIFLPYTFEFWGTPSDHAAGKTGCLADGTIVKSSHPSVREQNWNGRIQMIIREEALKAAGRPYDARLLALLLEDVAEYMSARVKADMTGADTARMLSQAREEAAAARAEADRSASAAAAAGSVASSAADSSAARSKGSA